MGHVGGVVLELLLKNGRSVALKEVLFSSPRLVDVAMFVKVSYNVLEEFVWVAADSCPSSTVELYKLEGLLRGG